MDASGMFVTMHLYDKLMFTRSHFQGSLICWLVVLAGHFLASLRGFLKFETIKKSDNVINPA